MKLNKAIFAVKPDHIFRMTDDTGMLQHSIYGVPNPAEGYTSDDNARALIVAVGLYDRYRKKSYERLIYTYLAFLCNAQNADGTFRNFMGYNREFLEQQGSEDCLGRCLWALCYTFSSSATPHNVKNAAQSLIIKALPNCIKLISPRAMAYVIIGLKYLDEEKTNGYISRLAAMLAGLYSRYKVGDWHWFEESMTYSNSILPWAMFCAFTVTKESRYKKIGLESLRFLESKTFVNGCYKPIGCNGWFHKGEEPAEFDEQPLEACETALAYINAYEILGTETFLERAKTCFSWYFGKNFKGLSLLDPETGGCYDGITPDGVNLNQGAESVVSFWMAYMGIKKYLKTGLQKNLK